MIKRTFVVLFIILVLLAYGGVFCYHTSPDVTDFVLRYNEVQCLRSGVDPFDVWSGKVHSDRFVPLTKKELATPFAPHPQDREHMVHAYSPWAYSFFYPFTWFSLKTAHGLYFIMLFTALTLSAFGLFFLTKPLNGQRCGNEVRLFISCLTLLAVLWIFYRDLVYEGYSILLVAGLVGMILSLQHEDANKDAKTVVNRWQLAAGFSWALAMLKPQVGLLFLVPLAVGKKWCAIITAGTLCLLASVPPAIWCGKSIISLCLQVPKIGAPYVSGNGLLPAWCKASVLLKAPAAPLVCLAVGVGLCVLASIRLRRNTDWLIKMIPAIVLVRVWTTYMNPRDSLIYCIPLVFCFRELFCSESQTWKRKMGLLSVIGLFCLTLEWGFWLFILPKNIGLISEKTSAMFAYRVLSMGDVAYWCLLGVFCFWVWLKGRKKNVAL